MIRNFFTVAYRSLRRHKGYSLINIAGLAVGMAVSMLIGLWVFDELSFNKFHENYDRIAQVAQHQTFNGEVGTLHASPVPLAAELRNTHKDDFKHVVTVWWESSHTLTIGDKMVSQNGTFMDAEGLEMFSVRMLQGNRSSLSAPASILLSLSAAKAIFGDEDPMNKILRIDDELDVKVTGVFEDLPYNSRFRNWQFISSWEYWLSSNDWLKADENNWNSSVSTFVEIQPTTTFETISEKIKDIKFNRLPNEQAVKENPELFLDPMSRWYLHSEWKNGVSTGGRIQFVWLFGIIGTFVLLLACINFMNLSTAQSERRAREVGIRKSIGSDRSQLINQFLSESLLVVAFGYVVAIAMVTAFLPAFNELADKRMVWPWTNANFWLVSIAFILVTSLLAGSYPALYLSSFQPVKVLKGTFKAGRFASAPRKVLVVLQFTVSIALIVGTIIVWEQIQYAKDRPIGYTREGLIMIRKNSTEFWKKIDILSNELKASGAVVEFAQSSSPATEVWFNKSGVDWKGKDADLQEDFVLQAVTHDYGKTMRWEFLQGRDFSREFSTDSSAVVLNETAVKFMGLEDPINEEIISDGKRFTVIGVIKDMVMTSPYEPVKQTIFWLSYEHTYMINLRINPSMGSTEAITKIEKVFRALMPTVPFDYKFTDLEYELKFSGEERIGKLASLFAGLAIFISCLGLFGMSSFVAEQRRKEIGIRKVLGASVTNLWRMLSVEFVALVGISCLIGIPIAWHFLEQWLQGFPYRTEISAWVVVEACAGALLITLATVSFQTLKASFANPVKSLRSE